MEAVGFGISIKGNTGDGNEPGYNSKEEDGEGPVIELWLVNLERLVEILAQLGLLGVVVLLLLQVLLWCALRILLTKRIVVIILVSITIVLQLGRLRVSVRWVPLRAIIRRILVAHNGSNGRQLQSLQKQTYSHL